MKDLLLTGWAWYPGVLCGLFLWTAAYLFACRSLGEPAPAARLRFHAGTLAALAALVSPLDALGDHYLFSAHMLQHLLLMFAAAPLWLTGIPGAWIERIVPHRWQSAAARWLNPMPALLGFTAVLYFWHLPAAYDLALENESLHIVEHLSFIAAALLGWLPVLGPHTARLPRPPAPLRMLYIFLMAIPCTALAAILTFAASPLYPFYAAAPRISPLDALQDLHLGGLLMWMPAHMVLLLALGITFAAWFRASGQPNPPERKPARLQE